MLNHPNVLALIAQAMNARRGQWPGQQPTLGQGHATWQQGMPQQPMPPSPGSLRPVTFGRPRLPGQIV